MRHVIVGTGAAGSTAARTIKQYQPEADVILVGEERFPPYNRYLLTDYLCGTVGDEELFHAFDAPLEDLGIKLRKGEAVDRVYPDKKEIRLEHGEVLAYDRLLIATGRRMGVMDTLRPFQKHIRSHYTLEDFLLLKADLPKINQVVASGQAVSTLSLILAMLQLGKKVSYVIRGPRVDIPILPPDIGAGLDDAMVAKGVDIVREDRIVGVQPAGEAYRVETYQGRDLSCDVVFAADTYRPNLKCVQGTGMEMSKGILVDLELHTSLEDIYAAGDCVEIYHPALKNYWINFGWPNAVQQGRVAGANMTGRHETYQISETIAFDILGKPFKARWWD